MADRVVLLSENSPESKTMYKLGLYKDKVLR